MRSEGIVRRLWTFWDACALNAGRALCRVGLIHGLQDFLHRLPVECAVHSFQKNIRRGDHHRSVQQSLCGDGHRVLFAGKVAANFNPRKELI